MVVQNHMTGTDSPPVPDSRERDVQHLQSPNFSRGYSEDWLQDSLCQKAEGT